MANWGNILSRGNVEDRRGFGPGAIGGLSLTGIALMLVFNLLTGGDASDVLNQIQQLPLETPQNTREFEGQDEYEVFASTVLGSNNEMWTQIFNDMDREYSPPKLVLFRTATQSACGTATSQVGPHYCPLDSTAYLDETFFEELQNRFGAQGGDVAEAYVISHEVGHHVQNILGILNQAQNSQNQQASIALELQADCFAGLWANYIKDLNVLTPGEIKEAMDAAAAVGDDRIQERVTGQITPENWTHGSSEQRVNWFTRGYESGDFSACNTFE
jgi:uncharacterized protein